MMDDAKIEILEQECRRMEGELCDLRAKYDREREELEQVQDELKKKSDLCRMYEHILKQRESQLKGLKAENDVRAEHESENRAKIKELEDTIDVLACRIAELKR